MRVNVARVLPCSAEAAWRELRTSALLKKVAWPLLILRGPLPVAWREGETLLCDCLLLGVLPIRGHRLRFERIDSARKCQFSRESNRLVRVWNHLASVEPLGEGRCVLRDQIEIEAGLLTWAVALFAQVFYRHRQRRWRKVAARLSADF